MCAFCDSEKVELEKDSDKGSYDVQEVYSLDRRKDNGAYGASDLLTNQSRRRPMRAHAAFQSVNSEVEEASVLSRSCKVAVGNDSHDNLTFQVTPDHFAANDRLVVWMNQYENTTEVLSNLLSSDQWR